MPEKKTKCRAGMALEKRFLGFDRYSYPVALNVSGKTSIPSYPGTTLKPFILSLFKNYRLNLKVFEPRKVSLNKFSEIF